MTMENTARALLIDDEAFVRAMLTDVLQTFGYTVDAEESGESALARFAPGVYDIVITDQRMPGMTGLEVASAIRRVDPAVPVILLTGGGALPAEAEHSEQLHMVYKPVSVVKLMAQVDDARSHAASR
jgi:DNA-binding NtrC family response regulator